MVLPDEGDYPRLSGRWEGDPEWKHIRIDGNKGTYTVTYGRIAGTFEFRRIAGRRYAGTWKEADVRHGTLSFELSMDGATITGTWGADDNCKFKPGHPKEMPLRWEFRGPL